jgi:signal transduction histidine kinase
MKNIFTTLYGKISIIFLLLLLLLGSVQLVLAIFFLSDFYTESDQKLNYSLAADLANKFDPFLKDSLDYAGIEHSFHEMMVMNPRVEFYLLAENGKILAYFADPEKIKRMTVNTKPIEHFLNSDEKSIVPIYGDDPRDESRQKPFSAAHIHIGPHQQGYLYVILGGELYDSAVSMVRNSYILRSGITILIIIILTTAGIGLILFFIVTRRIRTLTQAVRQYGDGYMDKRIDLRSKDELGQLSHAFNQMADTIKKNLEEIKNNDNMRRELVANISHDLRSPLASMQGYLETILIKEETLTPEERNRFVKTILKNTEKLNQLVYELFELSKLDAKQVKPQPEAFSLAELTQDIVLKYKPVAEEKKINMQHSLPRKLPFVLADLGLIERALTNLIDNAVQNTPQNGTINIALTEQGDHILINVADTGTGISEEDLPHIFDRFYRGDKSRSSPGLGLGLAITKKIIELHNSNINVQSSPGQGTIFTFSLPKY